MTASKNEKGGSKSTSNSNSAVSSSSHNDTRKASKPLMEKRRRARINQSLSVLKSLIVDTTAAQMEGQKRTKLEKADILEMTVAHLKDLKKHEQQKFKEGFEACFMETMKCLGKIKGSRTIVNKLTAHLQEFQSDYLVNNETSGTSKSSVDKSPLILKSDGELFATQPVGSAISPLEKDLTSIPSGRQINDSLSPESTKSRGNDEHGKDVVKDFSQMRKSHGSESQLSTASRMICEQETVTTTTLERVSPKPRVKGRRHSQDVNNNHRRNDIKSDEANSRRTRKSSNAQNLKRKHSTDHERESDDGFSSDPVSSQCAPCVKELSANIPGCSVEDQAERYHYRAMGPNPGSDDSCCHLSVHSSGTFLASTTSPNSSVHRSKSPFDQALYRHEQYEPMDFAQPLNLCAKTEIPDRTPVGPNNQPHHVHQRGLVLHDDGVWRPW